MSTLKDIKGVDISGANGNVDFEMLKRNGISFVMINLGNRFAENVSKAEAAEMPWGAYYYTYSCSPEEDKQELDKILGRLAGKKPTYPVAIDVEDSDDYKKNHGGWNYANVTRNAKYLLEGLANAGYYPVIYTGFEEIENYLDKALWQKYDMWWAQWSTRCGYPGDNLGMWQFGGEVNYICSPYIEGEIFDQNYAYKDYPAIIKSGGYNGWAKGSAAADDKPKGVTAQDVIKTAYSLIDKDENHAECDIMAWYGGFDTDIYEVACCCAGQMYLFNKANALNLIPGGKAANCGDLALNFYKAGQLHKPGEVKPGDLVTFSWSGNTTSVPPLNSLGYKSFDHVELCVEVNSTSIKCIGANNGGDECDDFQLKTRNRSDISGCCRPKYGESGGIEPTPSPASSTNSEIKSAQAWLNSNFSAGLAVDGIFGPLTNAALVRALQTILNREYGANLDVDGVFGPLTKKSIRCLENGSRGDYVRALQGFLICHGMDTGGFDGIFGSMTESAVLTYQTIVSIDVDGIAGPETFYRLANG